MKLTKFIQISGVSAIIGPLLLVTGCSSPPSPDGPESQILSMYEGYRDDFPDIAEVTPAEIAQAYKAGNLVIVDVREPEEQAVSMIPGAITQQEFEARRDDFESKRVVAHCTIGYRSGVYVDQLRTEGFDAENLVGSLLLWTHEGLPLEDADGNPTKRVHVYGKKWNLVAEGYEAVW
ncbi:MAG: rhodanese-like domain-containing protein [Candidatus Hydrogenedentota bacterium]